MRPHVCLFDWRAGEVDERRIRQGIAQVAGEAIGHLAGLFVHLAAEAILAAVRFRASESIAQASNPMMPARRR